MHTPAMATPMAVHARARGWRKGLTVMAMAKSLTQPAPPASSAQAPSMPRASHSAPMRSDKKPKSHTFHQHRFSTDPLAGCFKTSRARNTTRQSMARLPNRVSRITGGVGQNRISQKGKITL